MIKALCGHNRKIKEATEQGCVKDLHALTAFTFQAYLEKAREKEKEKRRRQNLTLHEKEEKEKKKKKKKRRKKKKKKKKRQNLTLHEEDNSRELTEAKLWIYLNHTKLTEKIRDDVQDCTLME